MTEGIKLANSGILVHTFKLFRQLAQALHGAYFVQATSGRILQDASQKHIVYFSCVPLLSDAECWGLRSNPLNWSTFMAEIELGMFSCFDLEGFDATGSRTGSFHRVQRPG